MAAVGKWCVWVTLLLSVQFGIGQTSDNTSSQQTSNGQQTPAPDQHPGEASVKGGFPDRLEAGADPENRLLSPFLKHLLQDQKQFWTGPAHIQTKDLKWILP